MDKIELLLHPVRMRIILAVANRTLTSQQLAALLSDVAQTTLYRQINLLLEGGILKVARESKIRGTVERELMLVEGAAHIDLETSAAMPPEQQEQLFTLFIATLLGEYQRASTQPVEGIPPAIYQRQRLYMSPEEVQHLNQKMNALLAAYKDRPPGTTDSTVQGWLFTGIVMPDAALSPDDEEQP